MISIGAMASIAWPSFVVTIERAKSAEGVQILEVIMGSQKIYKLENGVYSNTMANLEVSIPAASNFNAPTLSTSNPIASIQRKDNLYTLSITDAGVIACSNGTVTYCQKIGY